MGMRYETWRDYQDAVAAAFRNLGCSAEVDATLPSARGPQKIDVYVTFWKFGHKCRWLIECKLWSAPVPKDFVHTLYGKVQNVGADRGLLFSESGFQSGARVAAQNTNILLQDSLEEFSRTAQLDLSRIPLIHADSDEPDAPPAFKFPGDYQPHHLLLHKGLLFVGNWGIPQAGNIAVVDPAARSVESVIELDKYETRSRSDGRRRVLQHPPGNMACADGKLFVGQVFSDYVVVIDIETQSIIKRIPIPGGGEGAITASPDNRRVYFASNRVPRVFIIDSATYELDAVDYPPGGRGCLCVLQHPSEPLLYLGIQRGGKLRGISYAGGNCFVAIYDLSRRRYAASLYLAEVANNRSDDSMPISLAYDDEQKSVLVGMFQSLRGICRIDELGDQILQEYRFEPNMRNRNFRWVDPLSQALYGDKLLSVNRNNRELVILDKRSGRIERSLYMGEAPNGPRSVVIFGNHAIVGYPERGGLIFHDLVKE